MRSMRLEEAADLAARYGDVIAVYDGVRLVQHPSPHRVPRALDQDLAATFVSHRYSQVVARQVPHLYRLVDETKVPDPITLRLPAGLRAAHFLLHARDPRGAWLSPLRPTVLNEYRSYAAIQLEWNLAHVVMECVLRAGAVAYVGRVAHQFDGRLQRLLPGGAVQVFLPATQFCYLSFTSWWVPQ